MGTVLARSFLIATMAATLIAGTALGHECFVANRSDTGDIAAGRSAAWYHLGSLADLFGIVGEYLGLAPLSDDQLAWAVDAAQEAGLPNQITIFGVRTLAEGTPAMEIHAADGRGIDHLGDWAPVLIGIYQDAIAH